MSGHRGSQTPTHAPLAGRICDSRHGGAVRERFGDVPNVMAEPGRGMVAEAGHIVAEVILVSKKSHDDMHRWVYLDIGRFSGLAATEGEAIRYQFVNAHDGAKPAPAFWPFRPATAPTSCMKSARINCLCPCVMATAS